VKPKGRSLLICDKFFSIAYSRFLHPIRIDYTQVTDCLCDRNFTLSGQHAAKHIVSMLLFLLFIFYVINF